MRVAMLGWELPPFSSGGLGVHCHYLTAELAARGVEIDFFMPKTGKRVAVPWMNVIEVEPPATAQARQVIAAMGPYSASAVVTAEGRTSRAVAAPTGFFESIEFYNAFAAGVLGKRHSERAYDLIHGHDWLTARAAVAAKAATGLPLVVTMHSTEFDRTGGIGPWEWIVDFERTAVGAADRVIAVSGMLRDVVVKKLGADSRKVRVIHNGVEAGRFLSRSGKQGGSDRRLGPKVVLFHGRLSVQKGPEFFLAAARLVLEKEPDALFVVSGKGELLPKLVEQSIDLGISDRLLFSGYVPDELLQEAYASACVYVMPSVSEPFGITALEAMASGVPCIVSKTSGVTEVAKHCLKVDFWDTHELANKIVAVLRYAPLRKMMSENALLEAADATWAKAAQKTIGVYGEVLSK